MSTIRTAIESGPGMLAGAAGADSSAYGWQRPTQCCLAHALSAVDWFRPRSGGLRRLAALACAAAYLLGGTEMLPMLLALGASLEGSHTVHVTRGEGLLVVVLGHEWGDPWRVDFTPQHQKGNVLHRHGVAARMLCLLASGPSGMSDHVADFTAAQVCERADRQGLAHVSVPVSAAVGASLSPPTDELVSAIARRPERPALVSQPPPLVLLRSVVLLV